MKLLFIINGLRYGGMERQLVEIIRFVYQKDYKIYLAVLNKKGPMASAIEAHLEQPIIYLDKRKSRVLQTIWKIARLIQRHKIDLVYVQDSFSAFYALPASKIRKKRLINGSIRHAGVSRGWEYYWEKLLLHISDKVISNSQAGLDFYQVKGEVVYNFIDLSRFRKSEAPLKKIVMNANFSTYKDQQTLLLAGKRLIDESKVSTLAFIGDGIHRSFYEGLSKSLGIADRVEFHGHVKNIEELLLDYGIGILCSTKKYKEGISNSILEYMGSGLIAIASDIGATNEIIKDGENGFLFEAENSDSLYEVIKRVLSGEYDLEKIRSNAYRTLEEQFDPKKNCEKLISIFSN